MPFRPTPSSPIPFPLRDLEPTPSPDIAARQATFVDAEFLYRSLDGRLVRLNGLPWQLTVFSVHDSDAVRWIQMGLEGSTSYTLLLKLCSGDGPLQTLRALTSWLANPAATDLVQHYL